MGKKSPEAFRTISEVAEWLGVPAHVLRFWESRFGQVKPVKRAGGRRYYRPSDMELLGGIRKLLHEDGMTIRGVQKLLREKGVKYVAAMSPPIDRPAELRVVGESETAKDAAPVDADEVPATTEPEIEDAVELEPLAAAPVEEVAQTQPVETAAPDRHATDQTEEVEAREIGVAAEAATEPAEMATSDSSDDVSVVSEAPARVSDESPLDSPEAVEFFAHDAEPDTTEGVGDDAPSTVFAEIGDGADARDTAAESAAADSSGVPDIAPIAAVPQPVAPTPMETDAQTVGPAQIPADTQAPEMPAPTHAAAQTDRTAGRTMPDAPEAAAEPPAPATPADGVPPPHTAATANGRDAALSATTRAAGSGPVERDLQMPGIGPDPEDDADITLPPGLAAELRRHRAGSGGTRLNPTLLQAFADRLDELSGRLGHSPSGRRPF